MASPNIEGGADERPAGCAFSAFWRWSVEKELREKRSD